MNYRNERLVDLAADVAENAPPDPAARWMLGAAASGILAAYGVYCLATQTAWLPQTRPRLGLAEYSGSMALAVGCLLLAAAAFMHFHWFWSSHPRWHGVGQAGKLFAIVAFIASTAWLLYQFFVLS
jgi:hypothetical protein